MTHHAPNDQRPSNVSLHNLVHTQVIYREPRLDAGSKSVGLLCKSRKKLKEPTQVRSLYRERVKDEVYIATGVRTVFSPNRGSS